VRALMEEVVLLRLPRGHLRKDVPEDQEHWPAGPWGTLIPYPISLPGEVPRLLRCSWRQLEHQDLLLCFPTVERTGTREVFEAGPSVLRGLSHGRAKRGIMPSTLWCMRQRQLRWALSEHILDSWQGKGERLTSFARYFSILEPPRKEPGDIPQRRFNLH
jgi:hypothetical protein